MNLLLLYCSTPHASTKLTCSWIDPWEQAIDCRISCILAAQNWQCPVPRLDQQKRFDEHACMLKTSDMLDSVELHLRWGLIIVWVDHRKSQWSSCIEGIVLGWPPATLNTCDYKLESSTLQCPDDPSGPPALLTPALLTLGPLGLQQGDNDQQLHFLCAESLTQIKGTEGAPIRSASGCVWA